MHFIINHDLVNIANPKLSYIKLLININFQVKISSFQIALPLQDNRPDMQISSVNPLKSLSGGREEQANVEYNKDDEY